MTFEEFRNTLENESPPSQLTGELSALWAEARGEWEDAHRVVQGLDTTSGAWVHAYLHRKEGDISNAAHWYSRANRTMCSLPFDDEWKEIATTLLSGIRG